MAEADLAKAGSIFRALGLKYNQAMAEYWLGLHYNGRKDAGCAGRHLALALDLFTACEAKQWASRTRLILESA